MIKHIWVAIVKHCLGTPLSIQWPVSWTGLWVSTLLLFPCHWYAHIQITRPMLHSQGPASISHLHLMTPSLICKFFQSLGVLWPATCLGLVCPGRQWIMQRVLGVLEIQSSLIIPFTQAGCRLDVVAGLKDQISPSTKGTLSPRAANPALFKLAYWQNLVCGDVDTRSVGLCLTPFFIWWWLILLLLWIVLSEMIWDTFFLTAPQHDTFPSTQSPGTQ